MPAAHSHTQVGSPTLRDIFALKCPGASARDGRLRFHQYRTEEDRSKRWCEGTTRMHKGLASHGHSSSEQSRGVDRTHREAPSRIHLNHATQETLAVWWDKVWHVEHTTLDLLQQLPQVVIVKRQSPLWVGRTALIMGSGIRGGLGRGCGEVEKWNKKVRQVGSPPARRTGSHHSSTHLPFGHHTSRPVEGAVPDVGSV